MILRAVILLTLSVFGGACGQTGHNPGVAITDSAVSEQGSSAEPAGVRPLVGNVSAKPVNWRRPRGWAQLRPTLRRFCRPPKSCKESQLSE